MAHFVFETLAYLTGFRLYLWQRRRAGDALDSHTRWSIVAAAIAGAAVGSRLLFWFEDPEATLAHWRNAEYLLGGKTVLGGLLGGVIGVELTKKWLGITTRTGDLFAVPLAAGIAIGRIGCFLAGLPDRTYGVATTLPWGVDFGDGIRRHPTQLYESAALALVALWLWRRQSRPHPRGRIFQSFMIAYLALRLVVDAIKPEVAVALGLSSLQWAALAGLVYYAHDWRHLHD